MKEKRKEKKRKEKKRKEKKRKEKKRKEKPQMSMDFKRKLPLPVELKDKMPLPKSLAELKKKRDAEIESILSGADKDRKLLIIGPCSADRSDTVLDYCIRLAALQEKVQERFCIIPRIYTNKPRTSGIGYKGMLHQPNPSADSDIVEGVKAIRALNLAVISNTHLFGADELLYPEAYRFISDLISYVAVGARSVEDQLHRITASGLDIPVGMKNPTSGNINVMLNAINTAQHAHMFIYRNWEVVTNGNRYAHGILRGYEDINGKLQANCFGNELEEIAAAYEAYGMDNPALIIDCNHGNSGKDPSVQQSIASDVLDHCAANKAIGNIIKGFMIESYLIGGRQEPGGACYGQSITDACLGWNETEQAVLQLAEKIS